MEPASEIARDWLDCVRGAIAESLVIRTPSLRALASPIQQLLETMQTH